MCKIAKTKWYLPNNNNVCFSWEEVQNKYFPNMVKEQFEKELMKSPELYAVYLADRLLRDVEKQLKDFKNIG